jgi:hypothetical protein
LGAAFVGTTGFFAGTTGFWATLVGRTFTSSSELSSSSDESSLDTAFLLTTAFCFSSFLGCLSVTGTFLAPVLDSEVVLALLSPTIALTGWATLAASFFFLSSSDDSSSESS